MEQNFDTSFIPKRPLFKEERGIRRHEPVPVVAFVSFAVFFAALILTGVAFFFHKKEVAAVEILASQLANEKENFNPQTIEDLRAIGARLGHAKKIIENHVAVSPLLDLIQSTTNKSVYYQELLLAEEEKTGYTVRLRGVVPGYGLLHAQINTYRSEKMFRSVDVVGMQLDERTGQVNFEVAISISPEVMKYTPPDVPSPDVSLPPPTSSEPVVPAIP